MLKPSYFYGKTDKIVSYYQDIEDYLLSDIAKFLLNSNKIGGKADRELYILNNMGMNDREVVKRLSSLTKKSRNEVRRLLKDSVMTSFSSDKAVLEKLITDIKPPMQNNNILKILDAEWKKTNGELDNLTRTTMRGYQDTLLKSLNDVSLLTDSGVMSHEEACCKVIDKMGKDGLVIDYPTGAKRTLEAAVRCAVVTSMNQTAAQTTNGYIAEGGFEYVLITAHSGARHDDRGGLYSHDEWQGKAYKIRGSEKGFPNLADSTGYDINPVTGMGTVVNPHGLHGYNCRHSHQPWIKGLDNPWVDDKGRPIISKKESIERYENEQKQRAYERSIRQTKRELLLKQEEINNVDSDIYKAELQAQYDKKAYKLSQQQKAYNAFSDSVGLPTQANRTKTGGFGKHEAAVARGRARAYANGLEAEAAKASAIAGKMRTAPKVSDHLIDTRKGDNIEKKIITTWKPRPDEFKYPIEDVMNAHGFDGLPKVVSPDEFDKYVKEANDGKGFIAQRIYSAPDMETLKEYQDQLYNGKWYVDCSVGGSQYGQGMYCAADYTGTLTNGIKAEMTHYKALNEMRGNKFSFTETLTLDKSTKILELPKGADSVEYISDMFFEKYLDAKVSELTNETTISHVKELRSIANKRRELGKEYMAQNMSNDDLWKEIEKLNDRQKEIFSSDSEVSEIWKNMQNTMAKYDSSVLAVLMDYDAVNAVGHGESGSYTVILNRAKVIFKGE